MKGDSQLRGSFVLVMVLGLMMVWSWYEIFSLYLRR